MVQNLIENKIIQFNQDGELYSLENWNEEIFDVKRVFVVYNVPGNQYRGGHTHKECQQFLFAIKGCLEVILDNGITKKKIILKDPGKGIYIPPMVWSYQRYLTPDTVGLVLASDFFKESDYIRDYNEFLKALPQNGAFSKP